MNEQERVEIPIGVDLFSELKFPPRETQGSVAKWGDQFGQAGPGRLLARMLEEFLELCKACGYSYDEFDLGMEMAHDLREQEPEGVVSPDVVALEAADVLIMLYQLADTIGFDLHGHVDAKMKINRGRTWKRLPDGSYRHD